MERAKPTELSSASTLPAVGTGVSCAKAETLRGSASADANQVEIMLENMTPCATAR